MKHKGKVKFYSEDKGYGFIYHEGLGDLFFHITEVLGANPPRVGDSVSYTVFESSNGKKPKATAIEIHEPASNDISPILKKNKDTRNIMQPKKLDGFPCIRGSSISGFKIIREIGRISVGGSAWYNSHFSTANEARDALIEKAKRKGANAVIEYNFHNDRQQEVGIFGNKYFKNYFWAEGIAVELVADNR